MPVYVPISVTASDLAVMFDNDMTLFLEPGINVAYWADQARYTYDLPIGDASTVLDAWNQANGDCLDIDDIREEETLIEVEVWVD